MFFRKVIFVYFSLTLAFCTAQSYDDQHFYRASYFFGETRFEKPGLSTVDFWAATGNTNEGRNQKSVLVPLFDIYGINNMHYLGSGVPGKDPNNSADLALINLEQVVGNGCFGSLSFPVSFHATEAFINAYQNFAGGFFTQLQVPFRQLSYNNFGMIDLTAGDSQCFPNSSVVAWQNFLTQFDAILTRYTLTLCPPKKSGVGDTTWLFGWTSNYEKTDILDFIDTTIRGGILFPTGAARNPDIIFDLPLGYDKHFGFPLSIDMSFGAYEWLTFGWHAGTLVFLNRNQDYRIKTNINQSGMIKLAKAKVVYEMGPLWDAGAYFKFDHIGPGISFIVGYTFVSKQSDTVCVRNCGPDACVFDTTAINSDEQLKGWLMHTVHCLVEVDFAREHWLAGPRIGFLYNAQVGGNKVYKTNMTGGSFGLDIGWWF